MVQNSREQRKNNRRRVFVLAVILGLALSGYALWHIYWRTMASILPGVRDISSTSMELHELTLLTRHRVDKPIQEDAPPLEWHLVIPRAYLRSEIGEEGRVYKNGCCVHFFNLEAVYDHDSKTLSPATLASPETRIKSGVRVSLSNRGTYPEITSGDNCVRADDFPIFMKQHGNSSEWSMTCNPSAIRCRVFTHFDGWPVDLGVPRELYGEPQKICAVVRDFLSKNTVRRDKK